MSLGTALAPIFMLAVWVLCDLFKHGKLKCDEYISLSFFTLAVVVFNLLQWVKT